MNKTWKYAERELGILMSKVPDALIGNFIPEILALCEAFGNSGQSGGSMPFTARALANTIEKLCLHQPITPLTGADDEWEDVEEHLSDKFQNNRCFGVFKDKKTGRAYYLDAINWRSRTGATWHGTVEGIKSTQFIKSFPFTPKTFFVDVIERKLPKKNEWKCKIADRNQLKPVIKYYACDFVLTHN